MAANRGVFVSGAAGVIGLELVPILVERGYRVFGADLKPRPQSFPDCVIYIQVDLNDVNRSFFEGFAPDTFIHLAATFERSTETLDFWEENAKNNVSLSTHLLMCFRDVVSLERVVFASSYLVYDEAQYQFEEPQSAAFKLSENSSLCPRNLTGMAKLSHEAELNFLATHIGDRISFVSARIYRGYGRNSRDVISRWIRSMLKGEQIEVYNSAGLFDYIYAKDSARGLAELAANNDVVGSINLGTGRAEAVGAAVEVLQSHFPDVEVVYKTDISPYEASEADMSLWKANFEWLPEYDLSRAIPEIIEFERGRLRSNCTDSSLPPKIHILVTSASAKIPLISALKTAARDISSDSIVYVGDCDRNCLAAHVEDNFLELPKLSSGSLPLFLEILKSEDINMIIPTRDGELSFFAEHKKAFKDNNIDVVVSGAEAIDICSDKLAFADFCAMNNIPGIPTYAELPESAEGKWVVKERFGAGSELLGLALSPAEAALQGRALKDPIFQPYVEGREFTADAWVSKEGEVVGVILRERQVVIAGESHVTETYSHASTEEIVKSFLMTLDFRGHIVVQGFWNQEGGAVILECNPRFGGASTCSLIAGLQSFKWSMLEVLGNEIKSREFEPTPYRLKQIRVKKDSFRWL